MAWSVAYEISLGCVGLWIYSKAGEFANANARYDFGQSLVRTQYQIALLDFSQGRSGKFN